MVVPTCIFVLILGCLNSSYAQKEFRLSELFPRDREAPDTRTVVHIPKPSVNKGLSKTESELVNPQNEGYILVPQVVKVPKIGSNKRSASKGQRPSNVKRITSIDLLSDLNLNPSTDRLFNLTRSPPGDRFTDYTGSSTRDVTADTNSNTRRNRPSDLSRSSTRDVITELNNLSSRDRMTNLLKKLPKIPTDARVSPSHIEAISQILNVPKSKILAKLPQISRIFSQAAKTPSNDRNNLSKAPQMKPMSPPITKEQQPNSKIQLAAQKYPLVQQQSPQQQQNLQQQNLPQQNLPQPNLPQPNLPQQNLQQQNLQPQNLQQQNLHQQKPQQQTARLQIQQQEVPRLQLQQPEILKPIIQQNAEPMPAFTTNPKIFNSPQTPDMSSLPMIKAFTDGSERGMNPGQHVADPMNPINGPIDPVSMQQIPPDMPPYPSMGPPQKTFSDGSEIAPGGSMPPDLTVMQPMPQMGPDMTYSAMGPATMPQLMPTGNQMADMSFMPQPDMPPMSQGFQDTQMGMDPFGSNVDPACALGHVYATCSMAKIDEKQVYGDVDFSQQVDPMCTPIGNLMVNVKLFGFNPEDIMFEHGLHVHEYGDVRGHCTSAGPHYNPYQTAHGGRQTAVRHLGDFGNVREDAEGNVFQTFQVPDTAIVGPLTIVGKALVVKTGPDNLVGGMSGGMPGGMPFGGPGGMSSFPAGCCVIGKSDAMTGAHIYNQMPVGNMLAIS